MIAVSLRLLADVLARGLQRCEGIKVVHYGAMGGTEAVEVFRRTVPDVALLDYMLPGVDGAVAAGMIRAASPTAKILLLSSVHGPEHIERALAAGAIGFLPKSLSVAQVVEAIRQAHDGRPLVYADELADLVGGLNARIRHGDDLYARYATLTEVEFEILRLLGEGNSTSQVATCLTISPGTVKNRLTRIFAKTGAGTRMEAIDTARRTGLIPPRPGPGS